jgi:hypothetical protein
VKLRKWLLGLYPSWWRARYGEEFEALLENCLHSPLDVLDIALGAVDAHLELSTASDWRTMNTNNKLRTAILLVFTAYIAFILAGMGVYGFADDSPFIPMMQISPGLLLAWRTLQVGAVAALAAVVIGGAPLAWNVVRQSFTSRRQDLRLLLVPVLAFGALVLYVSAAAYLTSRGPLPRSAGSVNEPVLMWGLVAVFVIGAVASAAAVWTLVGRQDPDADARLPLAHDVRLQPYEFAVVPTVIATFAMLAMFLAAILWFWIAFSARPDVLAGKEGPLMLDSRFALAATLLLMLAALTTAFIGLVRLRSARLG